MSFRCDFDRPVELSAVREVASSPLCNHHKVFERSPGEFWVETPSNLYHLICTDGIVTGARTKKKPCADFLNLVENLGVVADIHTEKFEGENPNGKWDEIADKYQLGHYAHKTFFPDKSPDLTPTEAEVLGALQLITGNNDGWIDLELFAHAFGTNLAVTLASLDRKGYVEFPPPQRGVRLL